MRIARRHLQVPLWPYVVAVLTLAVAFCSSISIADDGLPEELLAKGKQERVRVIDECEARVNSLESARKDAAQNRNFDRVRSLLSEVKAAKNGLAAARKKTAEQYAVELRDQKVAKEREAEADEERLRLSGNCPLKPVNAGFLHLSSDDAWSYFKTSGQRTLVYFGVSNKSLSDVIAWEYRYQFLDGFDAVIHEDTGKSTAIPPGASQEEMFTIHKVEDAVQMKIYVERVKLSDGTVWVREPDHKQVGMLVKRLEGADLRRLVKKK